MPRRKHRHTLQLPLRIRRTWQRTRTINKPLSPVTAKPLHPCHSIGKLEIPLPHLADKALKLLAHGRMSSELCVRRQHQHPLWWRNCIGIVFDVPDAGCGVLGSAGVGRGLVEVELVAGGVRAEQSGEVHGVEAFVLKELEERVCTGSDVWQEAGWCLRGAVVAPNVGLHAGTAGAGHDCVGACEDDHVCHADFVGVGHGFEVCTNVLETVVLG